MFSFPKWNQMLLKGRGKGEDHVTQIQEVIVAEPSSV